MIATVAVTSTACGPWLQLITDGRPDPRGSLAFVPRAPGRKCLYRSPLVPCPSLGFVAIRLPSESNGVAVQG
jgi:hypothetical protein